MKFLIALAIVFSALPSAHAANSADETNVSCTGVILKTVTRKNGQSNDLEQVQNVDVIVTGNPNVALGIVNLKTEYGKSMTRKFDIEVSLGFTDGHSEKLIKLGTQIGRHYISTETFVTQEPSVVLKVDGLAVECRIN